MATAWFAAGRPRGSSPTLGKYESWCHIVGGVLAAAGVTGFLANLEDFYDASSSDESEWGAFLVALREHFGRRSFTAEELRTMLEDRDATLLEAVVHLWDRLRDGHHEELAGTVVWKGKEVIYRTGGDRDSDTVIASNDVRPELFRQFKQGDRLAPGWQALADILNPLVQEHALPTLVWDAASERPQLRNISDGPIGTVWTQFAEAVGQKREFERCGYCGRWFEAEPHARRPREFCTTRCRVYHFRARRKLAETRRAAGRSVDEIAAELKVDPAMVQRWFRSPEESRAQLRAMRASRGASAAGPGRSEMLEAGVELAHATQTSSLPP